MAISAYKFLEVDQADLATELADQLVAGFWLVPGGEGLPAVKDAGFGSTSALTIGGSQRYKMFLWDEGVGAPNAVAVYTDIHQDDVQDTLDIEAAGGNVLANIWYRFDHAGDMLFDFVFYSF